MTDTQSIINPTPKQRAVKDQKFVKTHQEMMMRDEFQSCLDAALLELQLKLSFDNDPNNHYRIQGAVAFISTLKKLTYLGMERPEKLEGELNYKR